MIPIRSLRPVFTALAALAGLCFSAAKADAAAGYEVLHAFERPGSQAFGPLLEHTDGNFYGAAAAGGAFGRGAIFRVTPAGAVSTLASFDGINGAAPLGGLAEGAGGEIFGTAAEGGAGNFGTAFKVTTAGAITKLADFTGTAGAAPGSVPGAIVLHPDGNFYGTTRAGGASGSGTVFRLTPAGAVATLAELTGTGGARPGAAPVGPLAISGSDLFGLAREGGAAGLGTIFKVTTAGAWTALGDFTGTAGARQGARPAGGLFPHTDGNLYGTAEFGGANNFGTAFRITAAGAFTLLRSFDDPTGSQPTGTLARGADGQFYGTTAFGGIDGWGTVFKMTAAGAYTLLSSFSGEGGATPGSAPRGGVIAAADGQFYGATSAGGPGNLGSIFRVTSAGAFASHGNFSPLLGWAPSGAPVTDGAGGLIFPVAFGGQNGGGALLTLGADGSVAHAASLGDGQGDQPDGALLRQGSEFFGTATKGGTSDRGTAFKYAPGSGVTAFVNYSTAIGVGSEGRFIRGGDGAFYAVAREGGSSGLGTFFKVGTGGGSLRIASFTGVGGAAKGSRPRGPLALATDAAFYGMTESGGANDTGTIFRLSALGTFSTLVEFGAAGPRSPFGGLAVGFDGNLYGTTGAGGSADAGTIFRLVPGESAISVLGEFTGAGGAEPLGELALGPDGEIYGLAASGGSDGFGAIFRYSAAGGLETLVSFTGSGGAAPGAGLATDGAGLEISGGLAVGTDGKIYGVTAGGGPLGGGVAFRLTPDAAPIVAWKESELGDPDAPDLDDGDFDRLPNLVEYALLLDPDFPDADQQPAPAIHTDGTGSRLALTLRRDPNRSDITVIVEASGSMAEGTWEPIATSSGGNPFAGSAIIVGDPATPGIRSVEIRDPESLAGNDQRFLRIRVVH